MDGEILELADKDHLKCSEISMTSHLNIFGNAHHYFFRKEKDKKWPLVRTHQLNPIHRLSHRLNQLLLQMEQVMQLEVVATAVVAVATVVVTVVAVAVNEALRIPVVTEMQNNEKTILPVCDQRAKDVGLLETKALCVADATP